MALTDKLTAIADGFRAARNINDKLTLDQMAQLAAESGVSDDVRYVTFMNGDEVVYVKPVAVGDDCVDVVAKGIISAPTKESTAQYNFTFAGWDTYNANHVDGGALKAVTENRTVYACYTSTVRSYTITYYDGDTVLKTEQLEYGSMPSYVAEKDGFNFEGWIPELATVTGNADYYSQWSDALTFAGASWADIARISEAGEASQYFKVGDTKEVSIDGATYEVGIIGFDHDDLADGSGKAKMTMLVLSPLPDLFYVNSLSSLATNMQSTLLAKFPTELQSLIKSVTKPCNVGYREGYGSYTFADVDFKLFPLSMSEMKINAIGARKSTDTDWEKMFPSLGSSYQYFEEIYSDYQFGPTYVYNSPNTHGVNQTDGSWIRQMGYVSHYLTNSDSACYYYSRMIRSSATNIKSVESVQSNTNQKTVQVAFCI